MRTSSGRLAMLRSLLSKRCVFLLIYIFYSYTVTLYAPLFIMYFQAFKFSNS